MSVPKTMRAAVLYDVDDIRIETRDVPARRPGEILVRVEASGICSGDVMPWYIRRKAPLVLGHEIAGTVIAAGASSGTSAEGAPFAVGDRVFVHHHAPCFDCAFCVRRDYVQCATWRSARIDPGGMAQYVRVPRENLRDTLRLPVGLSFTDASLIEPLGCVCKSLRRSDLRAGDDIYVIGLGVMGQMHVLAAAARGARVIGSDFNDARRALAERNGARAIHPDRAAEDVRALTEGRGARVVICGPGTADALRNALATVAPGGTVVMFTPLEPGEPFAFDADDLYFRDLRLVGSYSCGPDDTREALALLVRGVVAAEKLGATLYPLEAVPEAYQALRSGTVVKPIVVFNELSLFSAIPR